MKYKVGCVPYINAYPLNFWFKKLGLQSSVEVTYNVPSKLPQLLSNKKVNAIMVSSIESLKTPKKNYAANISISSWGAVTSVKIFSKLPFHKIQTLALDQHSLTSNNLAQIILKEVYNVSPKIKKAFPVITENLETFDAIVIIGDNCLKAESTGLYELDLGLEWNKMTDLPFVWALWIGEDSLTEELSYYLYKAKEWGQTHLDQIIKEASDQSRLSVEKCQHYLTEVINYDFTSQHLEGLLKFKELLLKNNLLKEAFTPSKVEKKYITL